MSHRIWHASYSSSQYVTFALEWLCLSERKAACLVHKFLGKFDTCAIAKGLRDYSGLGSSEYSRVILKATRFHSIVLLDFFK